MKTRLALLTLGLAALLGAGPARPPEKKGLAAPPKPPKPAAAPVIRLAPQAADAPRALKYTLLPDPLDLTPGNAAPLWVRAGLAARAVRHQTTDKEYSWGGAEVALKDLPRKDVQAYLARFAVPLRQAERAARRAACDWGADPLTVQTLQDLPMEEIQTCRQLAHLLAVRCRLELSEGDFGRAVNTLQTGFALARHLATGETLIQDLVAIAIGQIMLGRAEEWVQVPNSPNLYWALTALPRPLVDVRPTIRYELNTLHRSFPQLRQVKAKKLTPEEAQVLFNSILESWGKLADEAVPGWAGKLGAAGVAAKYYPDAKRYLTAHGWKAKEVEAMPTLQVVLIAYTERYDRVRDDIVKWLSVPAWEGRDGLLKAQEAADALAKKDGDPLIGLLLPAVVKVYDAHLRLDRHVAGLRGAEALRAHAAAHKGKAPAKWSDVKAVPLPTDPITGKGLDAFYSLKGGQAVLDVPPPPGMAALLGRRYELTVKGE